MKRKHPFIYCLSIFVTRNMSNNTTIGSKETKVRPGARKKGISWLEKEKGMFYAFRGGDLDPNRVQRL